MINPFGSAVFPKVLAAMQAHTVKTEAELLREVIEENYQRFDNATENYPLVMDWDDIVQVVAARYGLAIPYNLVTLVEDHCTPPHISTIDDSVGILQQLTLPHRKLVVASMGLSKYQMPVLNALGLTPLFHDFLMPDLTGYLKTDPRFYGKYTALEPRPTFISLGDRYRDDILTPKSCGFYALLKLSIAGLENVPPLERPQQLIQHRDQVDDLPENPTVLPDAVISHLSELPAVIEHLENQHTSAMG